MALRVWLPLNGSLENIGVSDIAFTNSNTSFITVDNNGKIGKCYTFNSTANNNGISSVDNGFMNKYINNKSWSICAWIKTTSADTCVISLSYGLRMFAGDSTHTLISLYNSSRTVSCTSPTAVNDGKWHHLAATYGINTNMINFYIDGINVKTTAYTSGYTYASSWTNGLFIGKDPNNSTVNDHYLYKGSLNDVRIYDHCLSAKEVKEIAQGLILHYKLNNPYSEGTTNLLQDFDTSFVSYSNGTTTLFTNQMGTSAVQEITVFNGVKCLHLKSSGSNNRVYRTLNTLNGKTYTVSCDYYANTSQSQALRIERNGGNYSWAAVNIGYASPGTWQRLSLTVTNTSDTTFYYFFYGNNGEDIYVKNIQIEENDHATPYTLSSREEGRIADSSGYGNNGIAVKSPQIVFDENSRYNICAQFNGSNTYINAGTGAKVKDAITIAWWGNMSSWSSYTRAISCTEGGGWNFEPSSGKLNFAMGTGASSNTYKSCTSNTTLASLSAGWHHFVGTYDGLVSNLYIDGVLDKTLTCYSTKTPIYYHASNSILVGAEAGGGSTPANNYFNGKLFDIRIYATALSAEDILDLYHTPANIDNLGGMHGFEFNETQTSTLSDFTLSSSNWVADGAIATYGNDSKIGPIVTIVPSSGNRRIYHNVTNVWTTGTTYLVSFLAKSSAVGTITPSRSLVDNGPAFSTTTNWKQYYGLITSTATPGGGTLSLTCAGTNTYYIANVKLELANQNLISILENGIVQENWLDENNFQSHASFLKTSSNIIANNFIEK